MNLTQARTQAVIGICLGALVGYGGYRLADSYVKRLSHHEGFFQVAVADEVAPVLAARPRHTALVVVDGLRLDSAQKMAAMAQLMPHGRCFQMDVGLPSVSRPVYSVLSTGLEQDRTGARGNDTTDPMAAESVWDVARKHGLRVEARSGLTWWQELFPQGFDDYKVFEEQDNVFPPALTADLTLLHPVAVDETAHREGAQGPSYQAAVEKVDRELSALLSTVDWQQDLVVVTADHGHRDIGGHGGPEPEVVNVLTCYAGKGVLAGSGGGTALEPLRATTVAPSLAVLLGLPFPRHMRAGEDDLDHISTLADGAQLGEAYLEGRRRAISLFRQENVKALEQWSEGKARRWSEWYALNRQAQGLRALLATSVLGILLAWRLGRQTLRADRILSMVFLLVVPWLAVGIFDGLAGGLSASAINRRELFIQNALVASFGALMLGSLVHFWRVRDLPRLSRDVTTVMWGAVGFNLAHILAYGWPVGFPIPGPIGYFAPFLGSLFMGASGLYLMGLSLLRLVRGAVKAPVE